MHSLLTPLVISIIPRWSDAAAVVSALPADHVIALAASDSEAQRYRDLWSNKEDVPLMIIRCQPECALSLGVDAVCEFASHKPGRAVCVLGDGPDAEGFREERRKQWNFMLGAALAEALLDIQVYEFSSAWVTHPPRIR